MDHVVPPGHLVRLLQKALLYLEAEARYRKDPPDAVPRIVGYTIPTTLPLPPLPKHVPPPTPPPAAPVTTGGDSKRQRAKAPRPNRNLLLLRVNPQQLVANSRLPRPPPPKSPRKRWWPEKPQRRRRPGQFPKRVPPAKPTRPYPQKRQPHHPQLPLRPSRRWAAPTAVEPVQGQGQDLLPSSTLLRPATRAKNEQSRRRRRQLRLPTAMSRWKTRRRLRFRIDRTGGERPSRRGRKLLRQRPSGKRRVPHQRRRRRGRSVPPNASAKRMI